MGEDSKGGPIFNGLRNGEALRRGGKHRQEPRSKCRRKGRSWREWKLERKRREGGGRKEEKEERVREGKGKLGRGWGRKGREATTAGGE